jgi:hypothetical protein
MSLYAEKEQLASVYHMTDTDSTKISVYASTASFTIQMFIIRRNEDTVALLGQEIGEFVSNVNGSYTNASSFEKGDKIVWDSGTYIVVNTPKYNELFNVYHLVLKRQV